MGVPDPEVRNSTVKSTEDPRGFSAVGEIAGGIAVDADESRFDFGEELIQSFGRFAPWGEGGDDADVISVESEVFQNSTKICRGAEFFGGRNRTGTKCQQSDSKLGGQRHCLLEGVDSPVEILGFDERTPQGKIETDQTQSEFPEKKLKLSAGGLSELLGLKFVSGIEEQTLGTDRRCTFDSLPNREAEADRGYADL
jgi:hypothetical protein